MRAACPCCNAARVSAAHRSVQAKAWQFSRPAARTKRHPRRRNRRAGPAFRRPVRSTRSAARFACGTADGGNDAAASLVIGAPSMPGAANHPQAAGSPGPPRLRAPARRANAIGRPIRTRSAGHAPQATAGSRRGSGRHDTGAAGGNGRPRPARTVGRPRPPRQIQADGNARSHRSRRRPASANRLPGSSPAAAARPAW